MTSLHLIEEINAQADAITLSPISVEMKQELLEELNDNIEKFRGVRW